MINQFILAGANAAQQNGGIGNLLGSLALPIGMLAVLYFILIRPQRKADKKQKEERSALKVGDSILTIGGVVGKIVNIKDDDVTIVTSVANTMMTFRRDAINLMKKPASEAVVSKSKDKKTEEK